MKKQNWKEVIKRIWKMAAPYWTQSDEKWGSLALLAVNIAIMVLNVQVGVRFTIWNRDWMNAFNNRDIQMWQQNLWVFFILGMSMIFTGVFNTYITGWINIRWRRWMTARYIDFWMADSNHYKMQLTGNETDNPDQRIQDDISSFLGSTWTFSFSFVQNIYTLITYIIMLLELSATVPLVFGSHDLSFPGYFVVIAIIWTIITTTCTHLVGKPLARLNYNQQMYDANFRFALVRVRECTEQIALLKGEDVEHTRLMGIFGDCVLNTFRTMGRNMKYGIVAQFLAYADSFMFSFLLGPAYFYTGAISGYGVFMQLATAFQNVVNGFKWFQTNYAMLASYVAVTDRLYAFNANYEKTKDIQEQSAIKLTPSDIDEIDVKKLDVFLPTGHKQISANDLVIKHGEKVLIKGKTGAGKTTLFRVLAGIWPFGAGDVELPKDKKVIVLPQKPYFPIGTLVEAVSYPASPDTYSREAIQKVLVDVGMPNLVSRLDEVAHWNLMLSGGEQQRLGIARAMLYNPDYLFFDEATASMDEPSEEELYKMLLVKMKDSTIISIGHRSSLEKFHNRIITAEQQPTGSFLFVESAKV
jgi:putative ATP-binding cassette transporter